MRNFLLNPVPTERNLSGNAWRVVVATECFVHLLLAIGGGFLLARRIQGAMSSPASFELLSVTGVAIACWLATSVWRSRVFAKFTVSTSLGVLASVLIASAISIPESSVLGVLILWTPILATAGYFSWTQIAAQRAEVDTTKSSSIAPVKEDQSPAVEEAMAEADERAIFQTITRFLDDDGTEVISGKVRCRFEANERLQNAHIGFCPVLDVEPEVFAEIVDGPDADVAVGQVLCTGVRFDVKMQHPPADQTSVLIEFYARCPETDILNS